MGTSGPQKSKKDKGSTSSVPTQVKNRLVKHILDTEGGFTVFEILCLNYRKSGNSHVYSPMSLGALEMVTTRYPHAKFYVFQPFNYNLKHTGGYGVTWIPVDDLPIWAARSKLFQEKEHVENPFGA